MALSREPHNSATVAEHVFFFCYTSKSPPTAFGLTHHTPTAVASAVFNLLISAHGCLERCMKMLICTQRENEFNYTLFFLCCLSSPTLSSFKNHYNFASYLFLLFFLLTSPLATFSLIHITWGCAKNQYSTSKLTREGWLN